MIPDRNRFRRILPLIRWVRRVGPVRSLGLTLGVFTLLLLGCFALTERSPWRREPLPEPPPEIRINRLVRVRLLGRGPQSSVQLAIRSPYRLTLGGFGASPRHYPTALSTCQVGPGSVSGIQLGDRYYPCDDLLITPEHDASLVVNHRTYRGLLRIMREGSGLSLINHVDMESYLKGVLRGELPETYHPEAFKAQCVAARTYAFYQIRNNAAGVDFDVYDNEGSQMYIGVLGEQSHKALDAVRQTRGEVCVWNDHGRDTIFCTYYSATCGGSSQHVNNMKPNDPNVAPLAGQVACQDCYLHKFYRWGPVSISKRELTRRIVARYPSVKNLGTIVRLRPKERTADGRIVRIQLDGSTGRNETLVGEDFRLSCGGRVLKSTNFVIETTPDAFHFREGKGYGHGVGLCQSGMETKARRGMDYRRILSVYYPTSRIKTLYQ
ncbi:MAG: SpoIID/LytB domain-containing protein [Phycisphaerae bacterium]